MSSTWLHKYLLKKRHWARYPDHQLAAVKSDNKGINQLNCITLVTNTRREIIESKFGNKSKIEHRPQFAMAQLEFYGVSIPPIYGSLNITLIVKKWKNETSVCDADDIDVHDK